MPRLIDSHCHIGSYDLLAAEPYTAGKLIEAWDKVGIDCGVISVVGKSMTAANNLAAEAADKHPGRIFARIYLDPTDPGALAELNRCAADRPEVFRAGVKLHPSEDAWYPFHEQWFPLYEDIQRRGLSVLIHTGTYPHSDPLACAYAAKAFPEIPWILGHAGLADLTWHMAPAARLAGNVYADPALNATLPPLVSWVKEFGAHRMLWASDWPFGGIRAEAAKLDDFRDMGLTAAEVDQIAGGNAARMFGL